MCPTSPPRCHDRLLETQTTRAGEAKCRGVRCRGGAPSWELEAIAIDGWRSWPIETEKILKVLYSRLLLGWRPNVAAVEWQVAAGPATARGGEWG